MQGARRRKLIDGMPRLEVRIDLDERLRPVALGVVGGLDELRDVLALDPREAARELAVLPDQLLPKLEYVHARLVINRFSGQRPRIQRYIRQLAAMQFEL